MWFYYTFPKTMSLSEGIWSVWRATCSRVTVAWWCWCCWSRVCVLTWSREGWFAGFGRSSAASLISDHILSCSMSEFTSRAVGKACIGLVLSSSSLKNNANLKFSVNKRNRFKIVDTCRTGIISFWVASVHIKSPFWEWIMESNL